MPNESIIGIIAISLKTVLISIEIIFSKSFLIKVLYFNFSERSLNPYIDCAFNVVSSDNIISNAVCKSSKSTVAKSIIFF